MLKDEFKISIAYATRVPIFAVEPEMQLPQTEKERRTYSLQVEPKRRREKVPRLIEEEIFPLATGCSKHPEIVGTGISTEQKMYLFR